MSEQEIAEKKYQALKDSTFKQQNLPAYRPKPTFFSTYITFLGLSVILFSVGAHLFSQTNKIIESVTRYDNIADCESVDNMNKFTCTVDITLTEKLEGPVYIYYELKNFY